MIRNSFTKAAVLGTVFAAGLSGATFAQDRAVAGAWKIDTAQFNDGWATLAIERAPVTGQASGQFIVIEGTNVYLATGMDAHAMSANGTKVADLANAGAKLVLIGTNARRADFCSFKCQYGMQERSLTLRFSSVGGSEQLMGDMVAYNKK